MKSIALAGFLSLVLFTANAVAGETRVIELKDGSTITGEVLSLSGGVYTIKSGSLGTIKLEESKIRAIRSAEPAAKAAPRTTGGAVQGLQEKMLGNKEVMGLIESLKNDPEFKKILEDPEMVKAVQSGDVAALLTNPQFLKLLSNPKVKEIEKKIE